MYSVEKRSLALDHQALTLISFASYVHVFLYQQFLTFSKVAETISHLFVALTREILFLPLEHNYIHIFEATSTILYLLNKFYIWIKVEGSKIFRTIFMYLHGLGSDNYGFQVLLEHLNANNIKIQCICSYMIVCK